LNTTGQKHFTKLLLVLLLLLLLLQMTVTMTQYTKIQDALGSVWENAVKRRVLMVGAGGIGCELLKNLVMCGFKDIEIVCIQLCQLSAAIKRLTVGAMNAQHNFDHFALHKHTHTHPRPHTLTALPSLD
jgi:ubiquitin-like 1-activating enzyme E1 B